MRSPLFVFLSRFLLRPQQRHEEGSSLFVPRFVSVRERHNWIVAMDIWDNSLDAFLWSDKDGLQLKMPARLYHYTSSDDVAKIMAELKVRNSIHQEDKEEFTLGLSLLNDISSIKQAGEIRCWTFSLCTRDDNKRMLGKYSCSKSGRPLILEYDFIQVRDGVRSLMAKSIEGRRLIDTGFYFLLPCLYLDQDKTSIGKLKHFLFERYATVKLKPLLRDCTKDFIDEACCHLFRSMVKSDKYSFEHEYRLVRITFDNSDEERMPFGFSIQPYFKVVSPLLCKLCEKEIEL